MPVVSISRISVNHTKRRPVKQQKVAELMESIRANGLLNPITIDQKFNLIAGLHRLTAYQMLGLEEIECNILDCEDNVQARLAEIDENLIRSELEPLERSELWLERDLLLEQMGLRAKPGNNQYTPKGSETSSPPLKTTLELAKEVGYTERTYQQGKQIANNLVPEVKEAIKRTPLAKSTTALLKIARSGSKEREVAEKAEKAAEKALAQRQPEEAKQQAQLAAQARAKQRELQLTVLQSLQAQKQAKIATKAHHQAPQHAKRAKTIVDEMNVQVGDQWILERHLVYCGSTASDEFIDNLPSNAALALATPASSWSHDYLINEARVVAVLRSEGHIHTFCNNHRMPFKYELLIGNLYVGIFSRQPIAEPQKPIETEGLEGIVAYLVSMYTNPGNFVVAPFIGQGEVLITCERMGRICFAGDASLQQVSQAIARWQKWTGKQAEKIA